MQRLHDVEEGQSPSDKLPFVQDPATKSKYWCCTFTATVDYLGMVPWIAECCFISPTRSGILEEQPPLDVFLHARVRNHLHILKEIGHDYMILQLGSFLFPAPSISSSGSSP